MFQSHQSIDNRQSSGQSRKMRFPKKYSVLYAGLCLVAVRRCLLSVRALGPEWNGLRVCIVCPFTPQYVCLLIKKCQLCCAVLRGAERSGHHVSLIHAYIQGNTIIYPKALETSVRILCLDEACGLQPTPTGMRALGMGHYSGQYQWGR